MTSYFTPHPNPGTTVQTYTPGAGSTFSFLLGGVVIATGQLDILSVALSYTTGQATAQGTLHLTAPGADPAFYNELSALTGGNNVLYYYTPNFFSSLSGGNATFTADGIFTLTPVPEPSMLALAAMGGALLVWRFVRRRSA